MPVGNFLQLERGLAGDRQGRAAADRDQAVGIGQWTERRGPVEIGGADEALRQSVDCIGQPLIPAPRREEPQQRGECRDKGFGGGDAELRTGADRQDEFAGRRERALRSVDDSRGNRARSAGHRRRLDEIVAAAGLRDREE